MLAAAPLADCGKSFDEAKCGEAWQAIARQEFYAFLESACPPKEAADAVRQLKIVVSDVEAENSCGASYCFDPNSNTIILSKTIAGKDKQEATQVLSHLLGHAVSNALDPIKDVGGERFQWQPAKGSALEAQQHAFEEASASLVAALYLKSKGIESAEIHEGKAKAAVEEFAGQEDKIEGVVAYRLYEYYEGQEPNSAFGDLIHAIKSETTVREIAAPARTVKDFWLAKQALSRDEYGCKNNAEFTLEAAGEKEGFVFEKPFQLAGTKVTEGKTYAFPPGDGPRIYSYEGISETGKKKLAVFDAGEAASFSIKNGVVKIASGRAYLQELASEVDGVTITHKGTSYIVERLQNYTKVTVVDGSVEITDKNGDTVTATESQEAEIENGTVSTPTNIPQAILRLTGANFWVESQQDGTRPTTGNVLGFIVTALIVVIFLLGLAVFIRKIDEQSS